MTLPVNDGRPGPGAGKAQGKEAALSLYWFVPIWVPTTASISVINFWVSGSRSRRVTIDVPVSSGAIGTGFVPVSSISQYRQMSSNDYPVKPSYETSFKSQPLLRVGSVTDKLANSLAKHPETQKPTTSWNLMDRSGVLWF